MSNYIKRAQKIHSRILELTSLTAEYTEEQETLEESFLRSSKKIAEWMKESGLETRIDNIGNVRGKLLSNNPQAKTFVIGSQYNHDKSDSKFDGLLSILTGLDIAQNIIDKKIPLHFHLEIVAFSQKEDTRFHTFYLGSKALAGMIDSLLLDKKDEEGQTLGEALKKLRLDISKLKNEKINAEDWLGYLEIHTEQGMVLQQKNIVVSPVTALAGQMRIQITFTGKSGHAGIVPMNMRVDALCAAAQFILEAEDYATPDRRNLVATIGKIEVKNAAKNVIPHDVSCTLDIRSADAGRLAKAYERLNKICEKICHKRGVYFEWKLVHENEPVLCDPKLTGLLQEAIARKKLETIEMVSGAGYDAAIISQVAPVAMLFLKYQRDDRFNHLGNVEKKDIASALEISDTFLQLLNTSENARLKL